MGRDTGASFQEAMFSRFIVIPSMSRTVEVQEPVLEAENAALSSSSLSCGARIRNLQQKALGVLPALGAIR
jgi:hypothetical protein